MHQQQREPKLPTLIIDVNDHPNIFDSTAVRNRFADIGASLKML